MEFICPMLRCGLNNSATSGVIRQLRAYFPRAPSASEAVPTCVAHGWHPEGPGLESEAGGGPVDGLKGLIFISSSAKL
jgi:hypothetical protein